MSFVTLLLTALQSPVICLIWVGMLGVFIWPPGQLSSSHHIQQCALQSTLSHSSLQATVNQKQGTQLTQADHMPALAVISPACTFYLAAYTVLYIYP